MNKDCIFCKIVNGEMETDFIYETDNLVVFEDIKPSAPVHLLIVPKDHYDNFIDAPDHVWAEVKEISGIIQRDKNHDGFRLATNYGKAAMIKHMHVHYLSGIKKTRKV